MILAQASRLSDRQLVWVSRQSNDAPFTKSPASGHPAWAWAAQFADQYADDVVIPTFG